MSTSESKVEKPAAIKKVRKASPKKVSRRFTLGLAMALNLENVTEERRDLVEAVMKYYSTLASGNFDLKLFAVGSSVASAQAATKFGFSYTPFSNANLGAKRNAGIEALVKSGECDAFIRVGSDDLVCSGVMEEIVRRFKIGREGFLRVRGLYFYDAQGDRLAHFPQREIALAFMTKIIDGDLYAEAGPADLSLGARASSMAQRAGLSTYTMNIPDGAFVACKSGDELHSFNSQIEGESTLHEMIESPKEFFDAHFPTFNK